MTRKICVVTGSRAEYGLLRWLIQEVRDDPDLHLQLVATGMHLSPEFGRTIEDIQNDGFKIDREVEMLLSSDSSVGVANSFGLGVVGLSGALKDLVPDIVVLLGDRFEMLAASIAASILRIPIAHLHGGELTEGSLDDSFRHAITKLANIHFTSTEEYRSRVIQLGERPNHVYNFGSPGLENLNRLSLLSKEELEIQIGMELGTKSLMVAYHPPTSDLRLQDLEIQELFKALDQLKDVRMIFTRSNSDTGGRLINKSIEEYVSANPGKAVVHTSLGQRVYLSALKNVDGIVGNSSSGILEAPSFKIGTVNIGDRQKGRVRAQSVIDCEAISYQIEKALGILFSCEFKEKLRTVRSPYDGTGVVEKIVERLKNESLEGLNVKQFFDYQRPGEDI